MMTNPVSFITANYVARELGYTMTEGWGQGDNATREAFAPVGTFPAKFGEVLTDAKALGFTAVDVWIAHLHPSFATEEHLSAARDLLEKHGLPVFSIAGGFGRTAEELKGYCEIAKAIGAPVLAGGMPFWLKDRATAVSLLRDYNLKWAFENHPNERTPADVMAIIGEEDADIVGVACDTGWFGTNACSAPAALRELAPRLFHVHLKDVMEAGQHRTCRLGDGVVDIPACVDALRESGYSGPIAIEHEPEDHDPSRECAESLERLGNWMRA